MPAGKRPVRAAEADDAANPSSKATPLRDVLTKPDSVTNTPNRMMATTDSLNDTANLELTEGRHASAARAEEVKVELMRVNVFAPYEMAMRQKDQVVKMYGKVTDEHMFILSSAKQRAEQMVPLRSEVEKQVQNILNREQEENDRRARREEEQIAEEEQEMEAQVKEQEEEIIARAQDKQLLQKELQRAEGIQKNELAKVAREREGIKAEFTLQRADEERRAQERIDLLRQAQLREEEDMRQAFSEWKYARTTDANRHRNKLQLSTDAVKVQVQRARDEQVERTAAVAALRREYETALEKASRARSVANSAHAVAREGREEAETAAAAAREALDAQEQAVSKEVAAVGRERTERVSRADKEEADFRREIQRRRQTVLLDARDNMMIIRREVEDITGEMQEDPTTQETTQRRRDMENQAQDKIKKLEGTLFATREAESALETRVEQHRVATGAESEKRHRAIWDRARRVRVAVDAEASKAREGFDEQLRGLEQERLAAQEALSRKLPEARSAVVKRVKEVTRKFDKVMDDQLDACSRAKAKVDSERLKMATARRARRSAADRLTRDLRAKEDEWEKERKSERRRLAQLQEDMERAQQDLESRKAELGVSVEDRRAQLELSVREVEEEMRKAHEETAKERRELEARGRTERADILDAFARRREHLLAQKQAARAKVEERANFHAGSLEPMERLVEAADQLSSDLAAMAETMTAERKQLQDYEEIMDADIRKKLVEGDGMCTRVEKEMQERMARETARFTEEKAVMNAEAENVLAAIGSRRNAIRQQMAALQRTLTSLEEEAGRKAAKAAEAAAELRPELERHEESKMPQAEVDLVDEQVQMGRHVGKKIEGRIKHEAASVAALHTRLKLIPVDYRLEARATEFEAAKIRTEIDWLQQEDRSLLLKAETVRLRTERMINAKKQALATITDVIQQESADEQKRIKTLAATYKADFRNLPNERKNMLAAIAYKLSQLRVDTQKVDRNLAVLSASMSFKLNRTNRDEITELRHLALQEAHLAVEENKAMIDVEQSIRNRHDDLDRREQALLGNMRRRKASLEGQLKALPATQSDSDRFMRFLQQSVETRQKTYEALKAQVGKNELEREQEKARMHKAADKEAMSAGVSVEEAERRVQSAEDAWEAEEVKLQAMDEEFRQALLEATKEPELEALLAEFKEAIAKVNERVQEVRDAATARDVELRDRLIQLKRELQEEEKELRLWQEQRQQEYRDLGDQLRLTRAQVETNLKELDQAREDLEVLRRRNGTAAVVELKHLVLESATVPRETLRKQFQVEDQLRKDLEKIAEEEAEGWKAVLDRRHALHDMVHMTEAKLRDMRERADDLRLRWAEAEELAVEKQRVELAKRQLDADANRSLETQTVLLETARRLLREQGERSDAVEDKSEEQIREMDAKLMAKLATIDSKLAAIVTEKENELKATVAESLKELKTLETTVMTVLEDSRKDIVRLEKSALDSQDEAEREARAAAVQAKERAQVATEERVKMREAARLQGAKDRQSSREFQAHEHRRMCLKYERDMLNMGKTLDRIFAELLSAVTREEARLEEARQAEVRRLEIQAKLEMEDEMRKKQEEVVRKYEEQQKRAEEEAESMRKRVMEELARMEDEARKSIEEEVRKMQMLQVLMQQEAMIKMETAMREKMAEIQASSTASQERLEGALKAERERLQTEIDKRRTEKLEKLTGAWRAAVLAETTTAEAPGGGRRDADSAAAAAGEAGAGDGEGSGEGAGPDGEGMGATGASELEKRMGAAFEEIRARELAAYEEERRRMEAELAAIEAEIAQLGAEQDDGGKGGKGTRSAEPARDGEEEPDSAAAA